MDREFFLRIIKATFGFAETFNALCFVLPIVILFYDWKGRNVKNYLILLAHSVGVYLTLIATEILSRLIFRSAILNAYLPKAITIALYVIFFNGYKPRSKIILATTLYSLNHVFIEIGACIQAVFNANTPDNLPDIVRCSTMPLTVVVAVVLRIFNVDKFRSVPNRAVVETCGYSAMGLILSIMRSVIMPYLIVFEKTEYYLYGVYPQLYIIIALVCVVTLLLFCYFFILRNIRSQEENMELSRKAMTLETSNTLIALNQSNLEQMHKIRHDVKNRFAVMQLMLANKEYDRLENYFNELLGETIVPYFSVNTGNAAFDLVFNLELSKAKSKGVEVSHKLVVPPVISVSEPDLDGLIVNLMDNAIEACEKVEKSKRKIEVNVQVVHNYLVMRISNAVLEDNKKNALRLETDKPDKELHGYGSKIIDDIAKKYDGHVVRSLEKDFFIVDVMLDLECVR